MSEGKLAGVIKNLLKVSAIALTIPVVAFAVQKENPRGAAVSARNNPPLNQEMENNAAVRRSATSVIARTVSANSRQSRKTVTARPATSLAAKARSTRAAVITNDVNKSRAATKVSVARSGVNTEKQSTKGVSRAGIARATAVFNDVTKIGGGYASCRDAYATCMDQMCANANDTYRRCFCSDRFTNFRETSEKLDTALTMLAEFQNENLDAVDKTAAEVSAMYMATAGERAIKRDTSASQKLLNSISSILSGNSVSTKNNTLNSLGVLDFSGFGDDGDIWGGSSSLFGADSGSNIADLEGKALYNSANKQCTEIIKESCGSEAMLNLARSSYSIMISQDCNLFEKNINAKRASVEETVRTAEKYLRDARLEEYRAHNSADVNECLTKVDAAMRNPVACGENFEKCMDYTGRYINVTTGEPIYSKELFGLNSLVVLDGTADVLKANSGFDKWLDDKKMFATSALDSCRDLADTVWHEFKRSAIIQIAQAQDEKIQEIKDSCVMTIKECYDTQSGALNDIDDTEMQSTGAISATVARGMCYDRVLACAALYGDPDGCKYDDKTKKLSDAGNNKKCGLQSLLVFVDTVDSIKVAEGCEAALTKYAHELCDPKIGDDANAVYPMGCASMPRAQLRAAMNLRMKTFCAQELIADDNSNILQDQTAFNTNVMNQIIQSIYEELGIAFTAGCEDDAEINGIWYTGDELSTPSVSLLNQAFYQKYYGRTITNVNQINELNLPEIGWCVIGDEAQQCNTLGSQYATWQNNQCVPTEQWYRERCHDFLGGVWNSNTEICSINNMSQVPEDEIE